MDDDVAVVLGTVARIDGVRGKYAGNMLILTVNEGMEKIKMTCRGKSKEAAENLYRGDTVFVKGKLTKNNMTALSVKKSGWYTGTKNGINVNVYAAKAKEVTEGPTGAIVTIPIRVCNNGVWGSEDRVLFCSASASRAIWFDVLPGETALFMATESGECLECFLPA